MYKVSFSPAIKHTQIRFTLLNLLPSLLAELAESKWIFFGIFSHIQIWAIGIPLYIILNDVSRDASYLISAALTFIFSVTLVMLVIWPKMYVWARNNYFGGPPKPRMSISVGKSQTVVSGLDTGSAMASNTSMGADRARAEANARRVLALEQELEDMRRKHDKEISDLNNLVGDLQAQQAGTLLDAEVQHANVQVRAPQGSDDAGAASHGGDVVPKPPTGSRGPEESLEDEY